MVEAQTIPIHIWPDDEPIARRLRLADRPPVGPEEPPALAVGGLKRRAAGCGMCRLALEFPAVVEEAHRLHFGEGLGARELRRWMGRRLGEVDVEVPSARSISRHLTLHAEREPSSVSGGSGELESLLERLRRQLDALERSPAALLDTKGRVDTRRLVPITAAISACGALVERLAKVRSTDNALARAAAAGIEAYCRRSAEPFGRVLRDLQGEARRTPGAERIADRIDVLIAVLMTDLRRAGREAFEDVMSAGSGSPGPH
jgi:hypothetical protein